MCNFHSILGVAIGDSYELRHDQSNSHDGMAAGLTNKPLRQPIIFECECSAEKLLAAVDADSIKSSIIRNFCDCPEPLVRKIVVHYQKLKEALTDGKHLCTGGYFEDTLKYADVWSEAIGLGVSVTLPTVFVGYLYVTGTAKLDALTKVGGNLDVSGTAKLDALTKVGGSLYVYGTAKLDALTKVGGNLGVSGTAKLDALTKVGSYLDVSGTAKLDAPNLKTVNGKPHKQ